VALLKAIGLDNLKVLLLTETSQINVHKSSRNLRKVKVCEASAVTTFDVLNAQVVLFQERALAVLSSILGKGEPAGAEVAT
jgi:large subunit ribosomal protein L4